MHHDKSGVLMSFTLDATFIIFSYIILFVTLRASVILHLDRYGIEGWFPGIDSGMDMIFLHGQSTVMYVAQLVLQWTIP